MDVKTIILLSVGFLTIAAMIWIILRDSYNVPEKRKDDIEIETDHSESVYETVDENRGGGGGEESIYDS
jgi:hypothetical protein